MLCEACKLGLDDDAAEAFGRRLSTHRRSLLPLFFGYMDILYL
jgi:hypothetical protein